jgi:hypothetical protein
MLMGAGASPRQNWISSCVFLKGSSLLSTRCYVRVHGYSATGNFPWVREISWRLIQGDGASFIFNSDTSA